MGRIGLAVLLAFAVSTPAWGGTFKEGDTLKPDEGILVTRITCGSPVLGVQVFQSGKDSGGFWGPLKSEGSIGCFKELQTLRFKAGEYYIGQLYSGSDNLAVAEDKSPKFTIEAGKLNYIGDLYAGHVFSADLDSATLERVTGRLLTIINREPQVRQSLQQEHPTLLASLPFAAAAGLPPPLAPGPVVTAAPGQMKGVMQLAKPRWKLGDDGQPRICRRMLPLPKGVKLGPDETLRCDGDYVSPELFIEQDNGPGSKVVTVVPQDNGALILTFLGPLPEAKVKTQTFRRQLVVPAGQWEKTSRDARVCYDYRRPGPVDIASAAGTQCPTGYLSAREFLDIQIGRGARFSSIATGGELGGQLAIDYVITDWK